MEIDELKEKNLQKQLRKESIRRNWKYFHKVN
jgi:FtsZ-binding cell division protein ZapB